MVVHFCSHLIQSALCLMLTLHVVVHYSTCLPRGKYTIIGHWTISQYFSTTRARTCGIAAALLIAVHLRIPVVEALRKNTWMLLASVFEEMLLWTDFHGNTHGCFIGNDMK